MQATQQSEKRRALFEGFSLFAIIILLFIIAFTSVSTQAPLFLVLLGFSPTLLTIIAGIIIYEEMTRNRVLLWFMPFLLAGLFFYIITSQEFLKYSIKVETLTGLNIFFSVAYLAIFSFYYRLLYKERKQQQKGAVKALVQDEPKTLREFIASIEDKSKALNFAIGRVYSVHHGGTKGLREKITISPELYNEFSDMLQDGSSIDDIKDQAVLVKAVYMVNKIEEKLSVLARNELTVFGQSAASLKGLQRDPNGGDRIIDVLIRNDKDPVETYYKGAIEFCRLLKNKLSTRITVK